MSKRTCTIEGCGKPHNARGYCRGHLNRFYRTGDVQAHIPLQEKRPGALCSVDGCDRPHFAKTYCESHHTRLTRHGDVQANLKFVEKFPTPYEALQARTRTEGDCVIWTGAVDGGGYGVIRAGGKTQKAHRVAWELANGTIPDGKYIDHTCWTPPCVNVAHLRLATPSQNASHLSSTGRRSDTASVRNVRRRGDAWEVRIRKDRVLHEFGPFPTLEEATAVAAEKRLEMFNEFAGLG